MAKVLYKTNISLRFTAVESDTKQYLCVYGLQTLPNTAIKPAKWKHYLTIMHLDLLSLPKEYFERNVELYLKQKVLITSLASYVLNKVRPSAAALEKHTTTYEF
ncbi:hypothetical protein RF11_14823 [Thelohanellus kitauei]|uniref:Uncharacterized protein n=1 Tax=Thelohanellus kitauei TaxID=669202 RepID=A0A0C2MGE6_THEKT|nr:hypothetical protein RF11_14823 [Thelohanellus kitauei]